MRLGWPSYLIHGTNKPPGVGMRSSHGCIRLYPEDIEQLFDSVPDGTKVTVVNQPYLLGWRDGKLYVQTYDALDDDQRDWSDVPKALRSKAKKTPRSALWKRVAEQDAAIDWQRVKAIAAEPRGIAVTVGPGATPGLPETLASAPKVRNAIPKGATWDGVEDQYAGDPAFQKPAGATAAAGDTRATASP
jgi:L,D-transpeptidase ErfK/SrfK